ncbi:MAG: response regulator, partial [Acidimicrobiales bacterium]
MTYRSEKIKTLLLIEDDRGDALLVRSLLEDVDEADRLVWVADLESGLASLAAGPDCVLLDLGLPDAKATEALEKVIELAPDAAVVVFTGLDDEARGLDAIAAGAQDYVIKGSTDGPMLSRAIRYAIERKRAVNTARRLREAELRAQENLRIERGLLPRPLLRTETVRCMTLYRPGGDQALLGGDFFDVVELDDGTIRAMIGDVAGHGPDEAALGVRL